MIFTKQAKDQGNSKATTNKMKNLTHHKKQVKQHRARNRFQDWAALEIERIFQRVQTASNLRRDQLLKDLQRCNSKQT